MLVRTAEERIVEAVKSFSARAVEMVKRLESFSPTPYKDAGGYSIGYGHYMGVNPTIQRVTPEDADRLLADDLMTAKRTIDQYVTVPLSQNQYDALTSAVINLGSKLFRNANGTTTGFIRKLNAGDYQGAADELLRFKYSMGKILPALERRRMEERNLFLTEV